LRLDQLEVEGAARRKDVAKRDRFPALGRLELERRILSDALLVPMTSVIDFESRKVVYVVSDGIAELREVTLGLAIDQRVMVTEGLSAGDRYVVAGQQNIADGQRVVESEAG